MLQINCHKHKQEIMSPKSGLACIYSSLIVIFLLFLQVAAAQDFSEVDAILSAKPKVYGGQVAAQIYKDGKPIFKKEIGDDYKVESVQKIGYASKWLTAALVMTFVDKKELSLDDPISKYIPIFTSYSKGYLTIRQCLSEVTGIEAEQKRINRILSKKKFESLEEEVAYIAKRNDIIDNPGKQFYYGDVGYTIVGRVLEIIAKKKTFGKLMQERITKPTLMRKTNFTVEEGPERPADGAVSTAGDLNKFMAMLLAYGEVAGKRILSKEAIMEMEKIHFPELPSKFSPKATAGFGYGYGVWLEDPSKTGETTTLHGPGIFGTWMYLDRCRGYSCVILTPQQSSEQDQAFYLGIKEEIDRQIKSNCK
jgi:CubicO group peptidase (beta-lactamase class C family)